VRSIKLRVVNWNIENSTRYRNFASAPDHHSCRRPTQLHSNDMDNEKTLNRESLLSGEMHKLAQRRLSGMRLMNDEERAQLVTEAIANAPDTTDFQVFAYGSLIWNPALAFDLQTRCTIQGYHRSFCFWSKFGRGSEELPGLMMGLEQGGRCDGIAYRIPEEQLSTELDILFRREMLSFIYKPTWIKATPVDKDTQTINVLTFVVDTNSERFCGELAEDKLVQTLSRAEGPLGKNCDYLFQLVDHLEKLGFDDPAMTELAAKVRQFQSG